MKIFFDTEFMEDGKTIELLSLGAVLEDGAEFYLVSSEANLKHANNFVKNYVIPHLGEESVTRNDIKWNFINFCGYHPEFWADYCSYDWIVLCQLFGTMMDLPTDWPMYCNDIQTYSLISGRSNFPYFKHQEHNALEDAKEVKFRYEFLKEEK